MFKNSKGFREGVDTIVGTSSVFTGNIEAEGTVRVDGKVVGDLKVAGDVYVGDQANIKGNIEASNVHLSGTVEGNIRARGILKILSSAKLYGDIHVNSFVADEGALFQGKCEMLDTAAAEVSAVKSHKNYKKSNVLEEVYEEKK
ncbi:MAG TPA: polymer-forming cytoskeletal protein [Clostridia bacterium]|nr:polymer-forming cytoskeletal protein [Clostridia bacterium]